MVSMYLCSSGSNAQDKLRPFKGTVSVQKALQGSKTETRELLGGTEDNSVSRKGVIDVFCRLIFRLSGSPIFDCLCLTCK